MENPQFLYSKASLRDFWVPLNCVCHTTIYFMWQERGVSVDEKHTLDQTHQLVTQKNPTPPCTFHS